MEKLLDKPQIVKPKITGIDPQKLIPYSDTKKNNSESEKLEVIDKKITTIIDILKGSLESKKKKQSVVARKDETKKRVSREKLLEAPKDNDTKKAKLPNLPGKSFIDRIKDFFVGILVGYLAVKLFKYLPKLKSLLVNVVKVGNFIVDTLGGILNAFAGAIDIGYKAYDWTRDQLKNGLGEGAAEKFDEVSGILKNIVIGAITLGMLSSKITKGLPKQGGRPTSPTPRTPRVTGTGLDRVRQRINPFRPNPKVTTTGGRNTRSILPDVRNPIRRRPTITGDTKKPIGPKPIGRPKNTPRIDPSTPITPSPATPSTAPAPPSTAPLAPAPVPKSPPRPTPTKPLPKLIPSRSKPSNPLKSLVSAIEPHRGVLSKILKKIPLIGFLVDLGINYFLFKDPLGKAAFKAASAGLLSAVGAAVGSFPPLIPFGGPFIGGTLGGIAGDYVGDFLYDKIFEKKDDSEEKVEEVDIESELFNDGGEVRSPEKPNYNNLKPNPSDYEKGKQSVSPVKITDSKKGKLYNSQIKAFNQVDFFGPVLATAAKISADEQLVSSDFKSVGAGINNLILQGFKDGLFENNLAVAMNGGGIVSASDLSSQQQASSKVSTWVAKNFETSYKKNANNIKNSSVEEKAKTKGVKGKTLVEKIQNLLLQSVGIYPEDEKTTQSQTKLIPGSGVTLSPLRVSGSGGMSGLLDFIASGEGGYNSMNQGTSGGRIIGSTNDASTILGKNLQDMTIDEVMSQQKSGKLFAAGRYQIIPETMKYIVNEMGISGDTKFDKTTQDKLGIGLIQHKRPYAWDYIQGKHDDEKGALLSLAKEWASLPNPDTGRSYYGGGNKALHSLDEVRLALDGARNDVVKMQFGGRVKGKEGLDKVPAMLSKGEYVIDVDSAKAIDSVYPNFLDAVNKAEGMEAIKVLMDYASYYDPTSESEIFIVEKTKVIGSNGPSKPERVKVDSMGGGSNSMLNFLY